MARAARDPGPRGADAAARPRRAGPLGRRPGPRHAGPARARARTGRSRSSGPRRPSGRSTTAPLYYYLLAPAAVVSGADPVAVTGEIALFGDRGGRRRPGGSPGCSAARWRRSPPGCWPRCPRPASTSRRSSGTRTSSPRRRRSPSAAAIMARRTGRARWWVAAGAGRDDHMQCHVLGVVIVRPAGLGVGHRRRRPAAGRPGDRRPRPRAASGAGLVIAAGYVPLLLYELQHGFAETRAIIATSPAAGGQRGRAGVLERIVIVGLRSITWPVPGSSPIGSWSRWSRAGRRDAARGDRRAGPAPSDGRVSRRIRRAGTGRPGEPLARRQPRRSPSWRSRCSPRASPSSSPELPNDHYHAFLGPGRARARGRASRGSPWAPARRDPAGARRVARRAPACAERRRRTPRRRRALVATVLVVIAVTAWPPAVARDGGWPLGGRGGGPRSWRRPGTGRSSSTGSRRSSPPTRCGSRWSAAGRA